MGYEYRNDVGDFTYGTYGVTMYGDLDSFGDPMQGIWESERYQIETDCNCLYDDGIDID